MCNYIYNSKKFKKVSADCGRGKTYATCKKIVKHNKRKNHLVVQPSTQLLEQTKKDLKETFHVESTLIEGDGSVKRAVQYLKDCKKKGEVLLINWECYNKLPLHFVENLQEWWDITIDEIPQIDSLHEFYLLQHKGLFLDNLLIEESVNEVLSRVVARNEKRLLELVNAKESIFSSRVTKFFRKVLSPYYDVFVNADDFDKSDDESTIYFIAMLNPVLFKNATLLGAHIETNMLTKWFKNYHGVEFLDDVEISKSLLPEQDFTNRLDIRYFIEKANTKYLKNREMKDGTSFNEVMHQLIDKEYRDDPYIFANNNDVVSDLDQQDGVERIPVIAKGFNQYQHIHNFAFLPALNRNNLHLKMLNQLGIDNYCIKVSTAFEALYQDLMRTSLRDRKSKKVVKVIVVSKEEAMYLLSIFGYSQKVKQASHEFKYKKYEALTDIERKNRSKFKNSSKSLVLIDSPFNNYGEPIKHEKGNVFTIELNKVNSDQNDVYHDKNSHTINEQDMLDFVTMHPCFTADSMIVNMDFIELKNYLRKSSKVVINEKESHPLINSSLFTHQEYNQRTNENFYQSIMLILDFDDGDISIKDFENIFHLDAPRGQMRSFIICNSFSACDETPNKFRVFMPLSRPVTNIDDYEAVFDSVLARLQHHGYTMESMALDGKSCSPVQSYFMPCTNREHKEHAYFKAYGFDSARTLKQRSLNVGNILRTALKPDEKDTVVCVDFVKKQVDVDMKVADAKRKYLQVPKGVGLRNDAFFIVGRSLTHYQNSYEIEQILNGLAGNDKKMKGRIKGVLKSLSIMDRKVA